MNSLRLIRAGNLKRANLHITSGHISVTSRNEGGQEWAKYVHHLGKLSFKLICMSLGGADVKPHCSLFTASASLLLYVMLQCGTYKLGSVMTPVQLTT